MALKQKAGHVITPCLPLFYIICLAMDLAYIIPAPLVRYVVCIGIVTGMHAHYDIAILYTFFINFSTLFRDTGAYKGANDTTC